MKNFLFPLLLLPLVSKAQLIEVSASAGYIFSNELPRADNYYEFVKSRYALAASLSGSVKLPYNFRMGVSAARYRFGKTVYEDGGFQPYRYKLRVDPVLLELMVVSRNKFRRVTLDFGVAGGVAVHKRISKIIIDGAGLDMQMRYTKPWYTYGLTGSVTYDLSKRMAIGIGSQGKVFVTDINLPQKSGFLLPVMVKATMRI